MVETFVLSVCSCVPKVLFCFVSFCCDWHQKGLKYVLNEKVNTTEKAYWGLAHINGNDQYLCLLGRCLDLKDKEKHDFTYSGKRKKERERDRERSFLIKQKKFLCITFIIVLS